MKRSNQHLLRIRLPEGALVYASRFRELLARSEELPNAFFHLDDSGETKKTLPDVRVVGGRGWVGVLVAEEHQNLLYSSIGPAVRAVTAEIGRPVVAQVEQVEMSAQAIQEPVEYWVRELIIRRRRKWVSELPIEDVVTRTVLRGLETCADQHGVDLPTNHQLEMDNLVITKQLYLPVQTNDGVAVGEHAILVDAGFTLFAQLKGHWTVGNLQSRGYGRIGINLQQLAVNFNREEQRPRSFVQ